MISGMPAEFLSRLFTFENIRIADKVPPSRAA